MTLIKHELRQSRNSLIIWTAAIGFLIAACVFMFPEMKGEMSSVSDMFASMGGFSQAFGMDKISFGTLSGFYAIECGNILGLGGAFFAAICAASILSKEEKDKTAEFLLTHPIKRFNIVSSKLIAVIFQITVMNIAVFALSIFSVKVIGEDVPLKEMLLIHIAYYCMQLEIAGICFGISSFLRNGSIGIGLGVAAFMYFLNIIANIAESAEFLNYITPFGYANGSNIIADLSIDGVLVLLGLLYGAVGMIVAYIKYCKKDIA